MITNNATNLQFGEVKKPSKDQNRLQNVFPLVIRRPRHHCQQAQHTATNTEVDQDFAESSREDPLLIIEILQVEPGKLVTSRGLLPISPTGVKDTTINGATLSWNDNTGFLLFTIWGMLNHTLKNSVTYKLGPLRVKNYQVKWLSTTPTISALCNAI